MVESIQEYICCQCGRKLSETKFYKSNSEFYISGRLPICKDCFINDVKIKMELPDYKSSKKAMQRMCMAFDVYFEEDLFDNCDVRDNINIVIGNYFKQLNMKQHHNKTFENSIANGEILSGERKLPRKKKVAVVDEYGNIDDGYKISQKDIDKWGDGFDPGDYNILNAHYKQLNTANPNCDSNQEMFIIDLCYIKMKQMKAIKEDKIDDFTKLTESYRKSFTQAGLQVAKENSAKDDFLLGVTGEVIENYTPAEYYLNKELYKDFDGFGDYFKRTVLRPIKNLMFGTDERDPEYHVKDEEEAITVEELEDE